jgi:hypothetical protein
VHPGVTVDEVREATGFDLHVPDHVPDSTPPSEAELETLREIVDPLATRHMEFRTLRGEANRRIAEHRAE